MLFDEKRTLLLEDPKFLVSVPLEIKCWIFAGIDAVLSYPIDGYLNVPGITEIAK